MTHPGASSSPPLPWGERILSGPETHAIRFGPMDLWIRFRDGEIWLTRKERREKETQAGAGTARGDTTPLDPPDDAEWSRWATPSGERKLFLRPAFPDRPLVLEPEWPFRLLPHAEARIYVRVPLWVRVELPLIQESRGRSRTIFLLDEFPTMSLSDTWWGAYMDGELAYWLPTTARREMRAELFEPHLIVCPLLLSNRSAADLRVDKLAFRVAHLSVFAHEGHFWADESTVVYSGEQDESQVEMTGVPPSGADGAYLVTEPRAPMQKGFRARTFHRWLALPGMGSG